MVNKRDILFLYLIAYEWGFGQWSALDSARNGKELYRVLFQCLFLSRGE